jgi:hypothetical protein
MEVENTNTEGCQKRSEKIGVVVSAQSHIFLKLRSIRI